MIPDSGLQNEHMPCAGPLGIDWLRSQLMIPEVMRKLGARLLRDGACGR